MTLLVFSAAAAPARIVAADGDWLYHDAMAVVPTSLLANKFGPFMQLAELPLTLVEGDKLDGTDAYCFFAAVAAEYSQAEPTRLCNGAR